MMSSSPNSRCAIGRRPKPVLKPPDLKPCAAVANSIASSVMRHCGVNDQVTCVGLVLEPVRAHRGRRQQQRDNARRRIVDPLVDVRLLALFLPAHAGRDVEAVAHVPGRLAVHAEVLGIELRVEKADLAGRCDRQRERRAQQLLIDGGDGRVTAERVAEEYRGLAIVAALEFVRVVEDAGEPVDLSARLRSQTQFLLERVAFLAVMELQQRRLHLRHVVHRALEQEVVPRGDGVQRPVVRERITREQRRFFRIEIGGQRLVARR